MTNSLLEKSAARGTHRMAASLRDAMEWHPSIAAGSLWLQFSDSDEATIAYTDGRHVVAGSKFDELNNRHERLGVTLHEILHAQLGHPWRARKLAKRVPAFNHEIYNVAADALINEAILGLRNVGLPKDCIRLEPLLRELDRWNEKSRILLELPKWSSEALYAAMDAHLKSCEKSACPIKAQAQAHTGCVHEGTLVGESTDDDQIRRAAERLAVGRGSNAGLLARLAGELPKVETPWEVLLRDYLHRLLGPKTAVNWARPARRWSALERGYRSSAGVDLPFAPSRDACTRNGRIAVALDTSGSVDVVTLTRFLAEVAGIAERTHSILRLIVCDADVHEEYDADGTTTPTALRAFHYSGGGGTHFGPAIAAAAAWKPDVLVYLTDLFGPAGDNPAFPVVWAVPLACNPSPEQPPFGTLLHLD